MSEFFKKLKLHKPLWRLQFRFLKNSQVQTRRIGTSSQNALRLNYIIVFSRSRDHSFAVDFIEVESQTAPTFRERKLIYLHCLDLGAQESVQFEQFSCLQVKLVLGHVSFQRKLPSEGCVGFCCTEESDTCSGGSPISSPFGSDEQL